MRQVRTFKEYKSCLLGFIPIYEQSKGKKFIDRKRDALYLSEVESNGKSIDVIMKNGKVFSTYPLDCEWKLLKGKVFTENSAIALKEGWCIIHA